MLGGREGFISLMGKANDLGIRMLIDGLTRVSSSRYHRKYRKHLLHRLDDNGRVVPHLGSEGRALQFENTRVLNYRKKKVWELFLDEIVTMRE
jgi:starch synthase